jgi:hypothetical protein
MRCGFSRCVDGSAGSTCDADADCGPEAPNCCQVSWDGWDAWECLAERPVENCGTYFVVNDPSDPD